MLDIFSKQVEIRERKREYQLDQLSKAADEFGVWFNYTKNGIFMVPEEMLEWHWEVNHPINFDPDKAPWEGFKLGNTMGEALHLIRTIRNYNDIAHHETLGFTKDEAIILAAYHAAKCRCGTFAYFIRWDADIGNRYGFITERFFDLEELDGDRIVWSSVEGYY